MPVLTAPRARKLIHAARQDLEAVYLTEQAGRVAGFRHPDRRRAASALKPQVGYAELVKTLLDVTIPKGQTRTDWSKRPLTREQLEYAADDVLYLGDIADGTDAAPARAADASTGCARTALRWRT